MNPLLALAVLVLCTAMGVAVGRSCPRRAQFVPLADVVSSLVAIRTEIAALPESIATWNAADNAVECSAARHR